jgi:hypothetical protein
MSCRVHIRNRTLTEPQRMDLQIKTIDTSSHTINSLDLNLKMSTCFNSKTPDLLTFQVRTCYAVATKTTRFPWRPLIKHYEVSFGTNAMLIYGLTQKHVESIKFPTVTTTGKTLPTN